MLKIKKSPKLNINSHHTSSVSKLNHTQLLFNNIHEKLNKNKKNEKKSFSNKNNIISIDKMKNANRIINSKKKIEKILNNSNNINQKNNKNIKNKNSKLNLNLNLKRIKESKEKETNAKKPNLRKLILDSKNNEINAKKNNRELNNELNNSSSSSESDLGFVGEIIEDEADSDPGTELNEFNENNLINNPKSIAMYSSVILVNSDKKKRLSLSVNKTEKFNFDKKLFAPLKKDINNEYNNNEFNIKQANEIVYKIRKRENDIEKVKKQIEIAERNIKYYEKIIKEVDNLILNEENMRKEYQLLINFYNLE